MNCDEYCNWMQACLDGDGVGGDDVAAHQAACPECRALAAAARCLEVALRLPGSPPVPEGLGARIVAGVLADRRRRRRSRQLAFAAAAVAIAASLLLVLLALPGRGTPLGSLQDEWVKVKNYYFPQTPVHFDGQGSYSEPAPEEVPVASLNDNVTEAGSAVASLAKRTGDEAISSGQLLVPSVALPMPTEDAVPSPLKPPAQSLREAGRGVAAGLQPVADSAVRAFTLFRRDLPPMTQ